MIKNIFYKSLFILILTSALMFIGILFTVQYNNIKYSQVMIMNIMEMLESEVDIYDMKTEEDFRRFVLQSDKKYLRISVIATNGIVIADTTINIALNPMANHTNRSDVIEALHSSGDRTFFRFIFRLVKKFRIYTLQKK